MFVCFFTFQVIDEVDPAILAEYEAMAQQYEQPQQAAQPRADSYVPASGPAYASPSMLNPVYANARSDLGPGQLEASVLAGAEAYGVAARPVSKPNQTIGCKVLLRGQLISKCPFGVFKSCTHHSKILKDGWGKIHSQFCF